MGHPAHAGHDTRWALDQVAERLGAASPVCLVGHSLGGRAALLAAGQPEVRSTVALAPWVLPTDDPRGLQGKEVLIVHGTGDRIASPQRSRALSDRIRGTAHVDYVAVDGGKHAMLRHHEKFSRPAADFATRTLLGP